MTPRQLRLRRTVRALFYAPMFAVFLWAVAAVLIAP